MRFALTITHAYVQGMETISWILVKNVDRHAYDYKHEQDAHVIIIIAHYGMRSRFSVFISIVYKSYAFDSYAQ